MTILGWLLIAGITVLLFAFIVTMDNALAKDEETIRKRLPQYEEAWLALATDADRLVFLERFQQWRRAAKKYEEDRPEQDEAELVLERLLGQWWAERVESRRPEPDEDREVDSCIKYLRAELLAAAKQEAKRHANEVAQPEWKRLLEEDSRYRALRTKDIEALVEDDGYSLTEALKVPMTAERLEAFKFIVERGDFGPRSGHPSVDSIRVLEEERASVVTGLDPNSKAYHIINKLFEEKIAEVLGEHPKPPVDPIQQAIERGEETAIAAVAAGTTISILEQKRQQALAAKVGAGYGPESEEYKRENTRWARVIEREMK